MGRPVRRQVRRGPCAFPVQRCDVVGHVDRNPAQRPHGLPGIPAGLQHVADHQRDPEALADLRSAAEGQGDRKAGVVDPVQQPPQAVEHAEHARPVTTSWPPRRRQPIVPVIVTHSAGRRARQPPVSTRSGRAAGSTAPARHPHRGRREAWRSAAPRGDELGHVLLETHPRLRHVRAGVRPLAPPSPERPARPEPGLSDRVTGSGFLPRPYGEGNAAGLRCLLPRRARPGPGRPVRRGDVPQPRAPVRPVGVLDPPPPVIPAIRRAAMVCGAPVLPSSGQGRRHR